MTSDGKAEQTMNDETLRPASTSPRTEPLRVGPSSPVHRGPSADTIFEVVVATMWSDGELLETEVERGRATAEVLGVRPRGGGAFAAIADGPLPLPQLQLHRLDLEARHLAYAAALWVDAVNHEPSQRRSGFLRALATLLQLDDGIVATMRAIVAAVDRTPAPAREAFVALCTALREGALERALA